MVQKDRIRKGRGTKSRQKARSKRSGPDPMEKILEDHADVFADIVNVLLYDGKDVVRPENLRDGPTASMYKAAEGNIRQKDRDILKYDTENGVEIRVYGLENQTKSSNIMPVRVMGYDYASYDRNIRKEMEKNKKEGHIPDPGIELWPGQKLCPVVTLVLYFGMEPWSGPVSLHDMIDVPDGLAGFVVDYRINLIQVAFLPDETIAKFKSDFRIVAEFFKVKRHGKETGMHYNKVKWVHVEELLEFFHTFSGIRRYGEIRQELAEEARRGAVDMCDFLDRMVEARMEEVMEDILAKRAAKAMAQGRYISIDRLMENGGFSKEEAMKVLGFSVEETDGYEQWSRGAMVV